MIVQGLFGELVACLIIPRASACYKILAACFKLVEKLGTSSTNTTCWQTIHYFHMCTHHLTQLEPVQILLNSITNKNTITYLSTSNTSLRTGETVISGIIPVGRLIGRTGVEWILPWPIE